MKGILGLLRVSAESVQSIRSSYVADIEGSEAEIVCFLRYPPPILCEIENVLYCDIFPFTKFATNYSLFRHCQLVCHLSSSTYILAAGCREERDGETEEWEIS